LPKGHTTSRHPEKRAISPGLPRLPRGGLKHVATLVLFTANVRSSQMHAAMSASSLQRLLMENPGIVHCVHVWASSSLACCLRGSGHPSVSIIPECHKHTTPLSQMSRSCAVELFTLHDVRIGHARVGMIMAHVLVSHGPAT
jgi:hypothetical protein